MDGFFLDLRHTIRSLFRSPSFALTAVLTLALGIGATTALFSVVNGILLTPLPYRQPDKLVTVSHRHPSQTPLHMGVSAPDYKDLTAQPGLFARGAVERAVTMNLTAPDAEPERTSVRQVSGDFFPVLGVAPALGRSLQPEDDEQAHTPAAVISWGLWQRRFGGDSRVLGRKLTLDNEDYRIIGVMPESFRDFFEPGAEVFAPLTLRPIDYADDRRGNEYLSFIGRLAPGTTLQNARTAIHAMAARLRAKFPDQYSADWDLEANTLGDAATGNIRGGLWLLLGAVGFVLLIACANVANLVLARTVTRSRELAIRVATGASPGRVVRYLLTESLVLAVAGGGLGLLLTYRGVPALLSLYRGPLPVTAYIHVDARILGFALLVSLLTGILFGFLPALQMARTDLHQVLKDGGRSTSHRTAAGVRRGLVVSTVALALVLLVGAGLLVRSFARLVRVDPGFRADHLLTFDVSLPIRGIKQPHTFIRVAAALHALPGVVSAGGTTILPFGSDSSPKSFPATRTFNVEGYQLPPRASAPWGEFRVVTPGIFKTLGIPLLAGREFTPSDREGAPLVCMVDAEFVRRYWPNTDPIGKGIAFGDPADSTTRWIPVVGVVGHTLQERLDGEARVQVYLPEAQLSTGFLAFAVRTTGNPLAMVGAVSHAVHSADPDLPLAHINTMEDLIARSTADRRFAMLLLGGFALLAMVLASIGLYGVMSYLVTQRTREMGVRLVLGAERREVLRLVLGEGLRLALAGIIVGLVAALALTRVIRHMLFELSATDPLTFVTIAVLLVAVALVASYLPARRATRVSPSEVLRAE